MYFKLQTTANILNLFILFYFVVVVVQAIIYISQCFAVFALFEIGVPGNIIILSPSEFVQLLIIMRLQLSRTFDPYKRLKIWMFWSQLH